MREKGISLAAGFSTKSISSFQLDEFDIIVNLSEYSLPDTSAVIVRRVLRDPTRGDEDAFCDVCEDVEQFVRFLIEHCRSARQCRDLSEPVGVNPLYSEECAAAV